jgi:phosphoglycolate phosphatase-like HAD superfamily hydrolase
MARNETLRRAFRRPTMLRLILFDIDGTLIQSGGAGEEAFGRVAEAEFGIANGTAQLRFAGRTDPSIVRDFFVQHGIAPTDENFRRFYDRYLIFLAETLREITGRILPGVPEWLQELETAPAPPLIGLLTGNIRPGAQLKLSHYDLWDRFRMGAFGDDHEDRNRVAAIARERAQKLMGCPLEGGEILVIGDTPKDIECAAAIGARSLAVATGRYSVPELEKHSPSWTVESLQAISFAEVCDG